MKTFPTTACTALLALAFTCVNSAVAQDEEQEASQNPKVMIHTSLGDITLELFADKAPVTVDNFLNYVNDGFYNGTIFHRVISHFMIQGGGMTEELSRKPTRDPIVNEANNDLSNIRGTIAMARTSEPDSATSQFFINVQDNLNLDYSPMSPGYAVFGQVIEGMDVVDEIRFVETTSSPPFHDVPVEPVVIESVEVLATE